MHSQEITLSSIPIVHFFQVSHFEMLKMKSQTEIETLIFVVPFCQLSH
jgi:hypothetical protein